MADWPSSGTTPAWKLSIPTAESTSSTSYGLLATPDRISGVPVAQDALVAVAYQALWRNSVAGNAKVTLFIGANQWKINQASSVGGAPVVQEAGGNGTANVDAALSTTATGFLGADASSNATEVTTGQILAEARASAGGVTYLFNLPAGTYDFSVQFKNTAAGTTTVKNRHFWIWTIG